MSPLALHAAADAAWNDFLPWLLLGVDVFVLLFVVATGIRWKRRPPPSEAAPAWPGQAPPPPRRHASTREIREDVPVDSSAVVIFGPTDDVDEMVQTFEGSGGHLARRRISDADAGKLEASVTDAPCPRQPSL